MKIRRILLIGLFLTVGCTKQSSSPHSCFRMNLVIDPATLDPRKAHDSDAITMCRMLFEGLTRISKEGKPELAIAQAVDISEDGCQYTFHLRPTNWSNGEPVTSYDFAESWKQVLSPNFPTNIAYQLYVIKNGKETKLGHKEPSDLGIQTPDPLTLIVQLEEPTPYFLEICSIAAFLPVPKTIAKQNPNWFFYPTTFVGNGPFVLKSWEHTDEIRVSKNPQYWDADQVHLQEVSIVMVMSETEMQMFEDGKLDFAGGLLSTLPIDAIEHLKKTGQLKRSPLSGTRFLRLNTAEQIGGKTNMLSVLEFRQALSCAIDRKAITDHLLQGTKIAAQSFVPPEMELDNRGNYLNHHTELAKKHLQNVLETIPSKTVNPIVLSFIDVAQNRAIAQAIQQNWEAALGINVQLQALEQKVYYQKIKEKDFQIVLGSWIADYNDPINYLEVFKFKNGGSNNTNWENEKYIELLNQSTICRDQVERKQILKSAEKIILEEMPIIPLYHEAMHYLQKANVQDVALSPIGQVDLRWIRMEENAM